MPVRASVPVSSSVSHPPSLPPIYSVAAVRKLEAAAQASDPDVSLMERAGAAAARAAVDMLADSGRRVTVLAGPGNNGGDAIEVAVHLRRQFYDVAVAFLGDPQRLPRDAARALSKWQQAGGSLSAEMPARRTDLIVDGLFGIGLTRPPEGAAARWIDAANRQGSAILALDIPSGLQGDTGAVLGCAIRATRTVTFIGLKPGLLTLDGPDHSGELAVDALGFDWTSLGEPTGWLLDDGAFALRPPPRPRNFHKGNAGTVAVIGGAAGMVGAAFIAGRAALQVGAGKVLLGMMSLESAPTVDLVQPELMVGASAAALAAAGVVAIGPGLGREAPAKQAMREACSAGKPLVVDADALNLAATDTAVAGALTVCVAMKSRTP